MGVSALRRSPTLWSMAVYGAAGLGFAGANLILARLLAPADYGVVTLVVALANLGFALAPLGADDMVSRRRLDPGPRLLGHALLVTGAVGLAFGVLAPLGYPELSPSLAATLAITTAAGGVTMVAAAHFQSEQRFGWSLRLVQSPNLVLLIAALAVVALGWREPAVPLMVFAVGCVAAAGLGWALVLRERRRHVAIASASGFPWSEALALAGVNAAGLLLVQLERLVIPHVLPLEELATYGVLAAIAGSLFRVLQMGVGYALVPRLRAAATVAERRRLIAREAQLAGTIAALGAIAIVLITPLVERYVLDGKYHLSTALLIAAIVSGVAKILNAFARGTVTALAEPQEVAALNLLGWLSVAVAVGAAVAGARWGGLVGIIYGVALGWLLRAVSAFHVTARHLRPAPAVPRLT